MDCMDKCAKCGRIVEVARLHDHACTPLPTPSELKELFGELDKHPVAKDWDHAEEDDNGVVIVYDKKDRVRAMMSRKDWDALRKHGR